MDYQINLDSLNTKSSEFDTLKAYSEDIYNEFNSGYLNSSSFEFSSLKSSMKNYVERLKKGYTNSNTWMKKYISELNSLENSLSSFSSSNLGKPVEFSGEFEDLFSKKVMPLLQTGFVGSKNFSNLPYGSFTKRKFRTSNGVTVEYYLYTPDGVENLQGLPVMVYMHGGSSRGTGKGGWTSMGLTRFILDKKITPQGIVICPYIRNFEGDHMDKGITELVDSVVREFNADSNRISVSGHSYGAITAYRMVNKTPGYYAAVVPISGYDKVTGAFQGVKVWAFHGDRDLGNGQTNYNRAVQAVQAVNSTGGYATMHTFVGKGHGWVQNYTYEEEYMSPDGKMETVLDWAFRQDKRNNN